MKIYYLEEDRHRIKTIAFQRRDDQEFFLLYMVSKVMILKKEDLIKYNFKLLKDYESLFNIELKEKILDYLYWLISKLSEELKNPEERYKEIINYFKRKRIVDLLKSVLELRQKLEEGI